ncbi:hypothetical protein QA802_13970 [Streptomyces sp. B21-105]|uniref:hypothetical protein n=1 Tax=Streptomyces sp. B21-105 TaxID=3039417 RepID=UPI002FEFADDB
MALGPRRGQPPPFVRTALQRDAIDTLSTTLGSLEITETAYGDGDGPPACAALVR